MRIRAISILAALTLILAACSPGTDAQGTATSPPDESAATTTTIAPTATDAPDAMRLAYKLTPGTSYEYEVGLDQTMELSAEGDSAALGEDDIPGEASIHIVGTTTFTHSVSEGPETGTFEINITGDFTDLEFTGTMDGQPIEDGEIPDFTGVEPIDITIVVDEQGNVIPQDEATADLLGELGDMGGFGDIAGAGTDPGRFVGPPFAEDEVTVGDTWSETIEVPGMSEDQAITTEVTSEVTATDTVDGHDVFVIDTTSVTSAIEFDLAEFLIGFFMAFIPDDATSEDTAELDAIMEDLRFLFSIDETTSNLTTWFDFEAGLARQAEFDSSTHLVMDLNMPDEETSEMIGFVMDMSVEQHVTYKLTDSSEA